MKSERAASIEAFVNTNALPQFEFKKHFAFLESIHNSGPLEDLWLYADPYDLKIQITDDLDATFELFQEAGKLRISISEWIATSETISAILRAANRPSRAIETDFTGNVKIYGIPVSLRSTHSLARLRTT